MRRRGLQGLAKVQRNLRAQVRGAHKRTRAGLYAGAYIIQAEAQKRSPVDTGNLKGSATVWEDLHELRVHIGFQAEYAVHVHEDMEAYHEVGEAKFLENAVKVKGREVLRVIKKYSKVKR